MNENEKNVISEDGSILDTESNNSVDSNLVSNEVNNIQNTNSIDISNNINNNIDNNNINNNKNKSSIKIIIMIVVVIVAVFVIFQLILFLIAMFSVNSSIQSASKNSIDDAALMVASDFNTKYSEALILDSVDNVYGDVLENGIGYDFSIPGTYEISKELAFELNISEEGFYLGDTNSISNYNNMSDSFVVFDGLTFTVCLVGNQSSNYYVSGINKNQIVTIGSTTYKFVSDDNKKDSVMWACSDGSHSWNK